MLFRSICSNCFNKFASVYNPNTFCIKVSNGCSNQCTYCAVKLSRGDVKSKSIEDIDKEFKEGLKKNFKEFALIGTDVGSYGRDKGINLIHLLKELLKNKGEYKIKLRNIHPRFLIEMMPEMQKILKSGKIPYICSAVQSGNNRILKLMDRGYNIEDFKKTISLINKNFPEVDLRTQLMTGFPGETDDEFRDTFELLDAINFDYVEVYHFEARPGTKAAEMKNQVPKKIARRRYHKLLIKTFFHMCNIRKKKRKISTN